jgi:hypothetical protein
MYLADFNDAEVLNAEQLILGTMQKKKSGKGVK